PRPVLAEPGVAGAVEPVPAPGGIPARLGGGAQDLVMDLGLRHRAAEEIARSDLGLDLLAERDRGRWRLPVDLNPGVLLLLNPDPAAAVIDDVDPVLT